MVLIRQRPGSAKGVLFVTLEDETGIANLVVWPSVFEQRRRNLLGARGRIQREGEVVHLIAYRLEGLRYELSRGGYDDGSDGRVDAITVRTRDSR